MKANIFRYLALFWYKTSAIVYTYIIIIIIIKFESKNAFCYYTARKSHFTLTSKKKTIWNKYVNKTLISIITIVADKT